MRWLFWALVAGMVFWGACRLDQVESTLAVAQQVQAEVTKLCGVLVPAVGQVEAVVTAVAPSVQEQGALVHTVAAEICSTVASVHLPAVTRAKAVVKFDIEVRGEKVTVVR